MARQRHLRNAPIVEAVIDIRVKNPSSLKIADLASLKAVLKQDYPNAEERRLIEFGGKVEGKQIEQTVRDKGINGYMLKSADGKNVAQFRLEGFTFSRLKPYTSWEAVVSEARRLWDLYSPRALPELITRVAVRYINRLELPIADFGRYLVAPPRIPRSLPQEVTRFLTRIVLREGEMAANIIQALDSGPRPGHVGIILDIDVFKARDYSPNEESCWLELGQLRILKNRIFFGSIREVTARLYE